MRTPYIVGYDGSQASDAAVNVAGTLASHTGSEVIAVTVYAPPVVGYANPYSPVPVTLDADAARSARTFAEGVVSHATSDEWRVVCNASVPAELQHVARDEHAALLAVGLTHRGAAGRLVPGSVGERLIHDAPCPLLVAPAQQSQYRLRRIAVGYDGGAQARRALRYALALALRAGLRVEVLCPWKVEPVGKLPHGVEVHWQPIADPPGPELVAACREGVDLLVVGSRGRGPLRGAILGSTSRHLVDHAPCPVLVVTGDVPEALLAPLGHGVPATLAG